MKTMLYSEMIRRAVHIPGERKKAKVVDIVASKGKSHWRAGELMIESGFIDKEGAFYPVNIVSGLSENGDLYINRYITGDDKPKIRDAIYLSDLVKKTVIDAKNEEVGKIYDFEIYVGKVPWMVWKILVNPTGLSTTKRRVRIPVKDIEEIKGEKVILSKAIKGGEI